MARACSASRPAIIALTCWAGLATRKRQPSCETSSGSGADTKKGRRTIADPFVVRSSQRLLTQRNDLDFDPAIGRTIGFARFRAYQQLRFAKAAGRHAGADHAAARQVARDRFGTPLGQGLVVGVRTARIGVAIDVDVALIVL